MKSFREREREGRGGREVAPAKSFAFFAHSRMHDMRAAELMRARMHMRGS